MVELSHVQISPQKLRANPLKSKSLLSYRLSHEDTNYDEEQKRKIGETRTTECYINIRGITLFIVYTLSRSVSRLFIKTNQHTLQIQSN